MLSILLDTQYIISPGGNTPQDTSCTATCLPSRKLYKLDEPDTQDTAGEARTNSSVMYSYGPPHMAKQKQDDQLEHTYSSYVRIQDVALKTCQKRWMIGRGGARGSGISVLMARHDDEDYHIFVKCASLNCFSTRPYMYLNDSSLWFLERHKPNQYPISCYTRVAFHVRFSLFIYIPFFFTISWRASKSRQETNYNQPESLLISHTWMCGIDLLQNYSYSTKIFDAI